MSSGFHLDLFKGEDCGTTEVYVDSWIDLGRKTILPVDATDFIISSIPEAGCTCTVELLHSPVGGDDPDDWVVVTDANGDAISFECAGGVCTCEPITVSLLQYVKVRAGLSTATDRSVVIKIHYTTF